MVELSKTEKISVDRSNASDLKLEVLTRRITINEPMLVTLEQVSGY